MDALLELRKHNRRTRRSRVAIKPIKHENAIRDTHENAIRDTHENIIIRILKYLARAIQKLFNLFK